MAITTAKVTYSLNPGTVARIEELAAQWGVPKSEVVRRAIDHVIELPQKTPLEIFLRLQKSGSVSREAARKFNAEVRQVRRASGAKRR